MKPGQGQVFSEGSWAWKVDRLIELAARLPVEEVPIDSLRALDEPSWEPSMTVRGAVEHLRRVQDADLDYPILLSEEGWIMDGCHRVAKAILEGRKTIKAVRFAKNPPPDEFTGF